MKIKYFIVSLLLIILTCTSCTDDVKTLTKHETFINEYYNHHNNEYVWDTNEFEISANYTIINKNTKEKKLINKKLTGIINLENNGFKGASNNFTLETNTTVLNNNKTDRTFIKETLNNNGYYKDIYVNNNCKKYFSPYKHDITIDLNITNNVFNMNNLNLNEGWYNNNNYEGDLVGFNLQENNIYVLEEMDAIKLQTVFTFDNNYNITSVYGNITSSTNDKDIMVVFYLNISNYEKTEITESYSNKLDDYISKLDFLKGSDLIV